jgi:ABC-2 type transport system ATP-binding protein
VTAIQTTDLTRYYNDLCAVDHLDLTVEQGELFGFLGPNGAGKTTTIRMLTGLIRPTDGRALIDGVDVTRDPLAVKSRVGVVPQRSNLYGELSARDNLIFTAKLYGLPRNRWRSRADELLERFGLAQRADSRFGALSGGMKRRLTIAAALVHEPPIVFMDEPTVGLDVESARQLRALIEALRDSGVTLFLTTHLIHEAERLADRVAIIVKGQLVAVDTPAALCARVQNESVLAVHVSAPSEELLQALRAAPAIETVSLSDDTLRLTVHSMTDALAAVTSAAQEHDVEIVDVRSVTPSLEDAFVHITHLGAEAMEAGNARPRGGRS